MVAPGTACFSTAQPPATCGVAIDVPLSGTNPPPGIDDVIDSPGAKSLRNVARFENHEMLSVLSVDPTLTTVEMQPGLVSSVGDPLLPAATTDTMPIARSASIAGL